MTLQKMLKWALTLQIMSEKAATKREKQGYRLNERRISGKIMTEFIEFRAKNYNYLIDGGSENEKAKCTKSCFIKRKFEFEYRYYPLKCE